MGLRSLIYSATRKICSTQQKIKLNEKKKTFNLNFEKWKSFFFSFFLVMLPRKFLVIFMQSYLIKFYYEINNWNPIFIHPEFKVKQRQRKINDFFYELNSFRTVKNTTIFIYLILFLIFTQKYTSCSFN